MVGGAWWCVVARGGTWWCVVVCGMVADEMLGEFAQPTSLPGGVGGRKRYPVECFLKLLSPK